jgi:hypothetical protein
MDTPKKVVFAPGCFDSFEGTQAELEELQASIIKMFESGEAMENSSPLDVEALIEEDPEYAEHILRSLSEDPPTRNLQ